MDYRYLNPIWSKDMYLTEDGPVVVHLPKLAPQSSKTSWKQWLKEERLLLDGAPVYALEQMGYKGQKLSLGKKPQYIEGGLKALYIDDHIVVVEKPAGLLSVATAFEKQETVHSLLKKQFRPAQVFVVHRLDQATSGVMLFALSYSAYEKLKEMFAKHALKRQYIALVEGKIESKGCWRSWLREEANYRVCVVPEGTPDSKQAITHFEPIAYKRGFTLLRLTLQTGRKNQIRVQCQAAGHPVTGDKTYGAKKNPIRRLALHAHLLEFRHPISDKWLSFKSSTPKDLKLQGND